MLGIVTNMGPIHIVSYGVDTVLRPIAHHVRSQVSPWQLDNVRK